MATAISLNVDCGELATAGNEKLHVAILRDACEGLLDVAYGINGDIGHSYRRYSDICAYPLMTHGAVCMATPISKGGS